MKKIIFILFSTVFIPAMGQNAKRYSFSQTSGTYTPITGGTVLGTEANDDEVFNNNTTGSAAPITNTGFPIGFNFAFKGVYLDKFAVSTNGFIKLGTGSFSMPDPGISYEGAVLQMPGADFNSILSPFNTYLVAKTGSTIKYLTTGTELNRKLIVQWSGYTINGYPSDNINFQVVLYETSNKIEFIYGDFNIGSTIALNVDVGFIATSYADFQGRVTSTDWSSTAVMINSWDVCTISSTVFPAKGLTFSWSPPALPLIKTLSPAINAFGVAANSNLVLTFNEAIQKGTGKINIYENDVYKQSFNVDSSVVTISGSTVTINPSDFADGSILITIDAGAFLDMSNNECGAVGDWKFQTGIDIIAPKASYFHPSDDEVDVANNINIGFNVDEDIQIGTGNILIYEENILKQTIDVTGNMVSIIGRGFIINPLDFTPNSHVNILIPNGAIKDLSGNSYIGISDATAWNFTTQAADIIAPKVTAFEPKNGATDFPQGESVSLTFGESVQKGIGNIIFYEDNVAKQTIDVNSANVVIQQSIYVKINHYDFTPGAKVSISIDAGAFKDLSNNNYGGLSKADWSFTIRKKDDTSVEELNLSESFNIYPNPAFSSLMVYCDRKELTNLSVKLIDLQGRIIYSETKKDFTGLLKSVIDISQQSKGFYIIQIATDQDIISKKIVKE